MDGKPSKPKKGEYGIGGPLKRRKKAKRKKEIAKRVAARKAIKKPSINLTNTYGLRTSAD